MSRARLDMSPRDLVVAMCDGNPGAINVMMAMIVEGGVIDPDSMLGGLGAVLTLDDEGIYGPRIWMLFKDVCGQSLPRTLAALRAVQLGIVGEAALNHAIDNRGEGVDAAALLKAVQEKLPRFAAVAATPTVTP